MTANFKGYNADDLAFFTVYGSLDDEKISGIGDVATIRSEIQAYVTTQPKSFQAEFKRALDSELERKARGSGDDNSFDCTGLPDDISEKEDGGLIF